ncbi:exodeoxyribonuclease VII large subunit [Opitutales bacterium]|uniref:exodeoxyribonuclease VII large subunit n=1 Tax=Candidatus Seribacter sulfatis TaxID=3381756 RepID=UPI002327E846|nr:exodeoxyribonuclease VII large subunit [Opitutales bacterium]
MQTNLFEENQDSSEIWSVGQLTREIKSTLENRFPPVWIKGEISNLRAQPSGHRYFILKDSTSQIKAVLFKGDFSHLGYIPQEGDECVAYGNVTVYEPRGDYQFRIKHLMQDGTGNLRLQFDRLKAKLLDEGLFDDSQKVTLPKLPRKIALITSIRGAALQDFLSILKRRKWSGEIDIFNSSVQGRDAPKELINALSNVERDNDYDLVVLTRGGGAIEDLWAFNDEELVRAVASSKTPIISAIGHQTDFVLTDFAADFRAETPSASAEWITSQHIQQIEHLKALQIHLRDIPQQAIRVRHEKLTLLEAKLQVLSPQSKMESYHQHLDDFSLRMDRVMEQFIGHNLYKIDSLHQRLESSSMKSVLNRGFSIFENLNGQTIDRAEKLKKNDIVKAVFQDGSREMKVEN